MIHFSCCPNVSYYYVQAGMDIINSDIEIIMFIYQKDNIC